ncbi:hypothetical protein RHSIM_Rhsim02G0232500 [Rhododendron simsii]|uniref:Uncharacterized protein n=1 Tax=Rhododendron simsii TaxID=118357 RepID=A0A834HCM5_RHOSS|nr:hypothetical protein RHSIM_Rhsim02G0232500 [Rhododendron simsii]
MWILGRKGPSGFSACSTAEEVTKGIDGTGLTAITLMELGLSDGISLFVFYPISGASSGIGTETTRVLALRGVHVVMAVRNTDAGRKVREAILKENPNAKLDVMELDLGSMASVRKFSSEYKSLGLPLNLLINNAGVMAHFMLTQDNIELVFGTNHIGHFLLTNLLLETMKSTARESQKEGRIVIVSSEGHRMFRYPEGVRFDKINDKSSFRTVYAYGQSKLANILHANELAKRFKEEGVEITANSIHPGVIATNLLRRHSIVHGKPLNVWTLYGYVLETYYFSEHIFVGLAEILDMYNCRGMGSVHEVLLQTCLNLTGLFNTVVKCFVKSIPQGAATTCYVALHPQVKGVSGEYFSDSNLAKPIALAKDEVLAKKLWDFSLSLTDPK